MNIVELYALPVLKSYKRKCIQFRLWSLFSSFNMEKLRKYTFIDLHLLDSCADMMLING
jgi:hypothetical protein